ncbi:MAG: hypothetical protein JF597_01325 [Streptomyces sp.]|uniref:hypothetical protein n=1 Tax=Streptomyces sp. TaxID=1931 RepID=UPI0025DBE7C3|nr:hypothetical protein [Streptomyces sp.]MBW8792275.1 hypothetical protein [Streptomyces sp.]
MNLGELRKAIRDLPDSTELVVHGGDGEHSEMHLEYRLPPDGAGHGWALSFIEGQSVTLELNMDDRWESAEPWPDSITAPSTDEECGAPGPGGLRCRRYAGHSRPPRLHAAVNARGELEKW